MITEVDGNDMSITGDEFTLVVFHEDRPGAISLVSQALSESDINIATMRVFPEGQAQGCSDGYYYRYSGKSYYRSVYARVSRHPRCDDL